MERPRRHPVDRDATPQAARKPEKREKNDTDGLRRNEPARAFRRAVRNFITPRALKLRQPIWRNIMGFGRGLLLWLLGIPLPIIILLALFWH
jgi:hypothetical protein